MALAVLLVVSLAGRATAQTAALSLHVPGDRVVVLDPGHGGHDSGAVGSSGLAEKDVTLPWPRRSATLSPVITGCI